MRIITRQEFIPLPSGTVFSLYESLGIFGPPAVKECNGNWAPDFVYSELTTSIEYQDTEDLAVKMNHYEQTGETFRMDLTTASRDGEYDPDQLFAVYDEEDIKALAIRLYYLVKQPDEAQPNSNPKESSNDRQGNPACRPGKAALGNRAGKKQR